MDTGDKVQVRKGIAMYMACDRHGRYGYGRRPGAEGIVVSISEDGDGEGDVPCATFGVLHSGDSRPAWYTWYELLTSRTAITYETYDLDSGRRIHGGYERPESALDDQDACAILAADLAQYPEYQVRDFGVRPEARWMKPKTARRIRWRARRDATSRGRLR